MFSIEPHDVENPMPGYGWFHFYVEREGTKFLAGRLTLGKPSEAHRFDQCLKAHQQIQEARHLFEGMGIDTDQGQLLDWLHRVVERFSKEVSEIERRVL